jgi:hypothetical protein
MRINVTSSVSTLTTTHPAVTMVSQHAPAFERLHACARPAHACAAAGGALRQTVGHIGRCLVHERAAEVASEVGDLQARRVDDGHPVPIPHLPKARPRAVRQRGAADHAAHVAPARSHSR